MKPFLVEGEIKMANSTNTMWTVSCICYGTNRTRHKKVYHMDGRAYKSEKNARDRYDAIVKYLKESKYLIEKIPQKEGDVCEGVCARKITNINGTSSSSNYFVFIDQNPAWKTG